MFLVKDCFAQEMTSENNNTNGNNKRGPSTSINTTKTDGGRKRRFYERCVTSETAEETMRYVVPFALLVGYQLFCSVLFYAFQLLITVESLNDGSYYSNPDSNNRDGLDTNRTTSADPQKYNNDYGSSSSKISNIENCADRDNASFGKAFYFTSTVFFSIGYGDVVPCMWYGKFFTIIFALTGVPLTLFCLSRLGRPMKSLMERAWYTYLSVWKGEDDVEKERWALPLPVGIALTFAWIFGSSIFFKLTIVNLRDGDNHQKEEITYLDAVYFTVISLFTIGFGDLAPVDRRLDWITFTFIFIGLAMVSMCVAIAQRNMEDKFNNLRLISLLAQFRNGEVPASMDDLTPEQSKILEKVLETWAFPRSQRFFTSMVNEEDRKDPSKTPKIVLGALAQGAVIGRWRSRARFKVSAIQCSLISAPPLVKFVVPKKSSSTSGPSSVDNGLDRVMTVRTEDYGGVATMECHKNHETRDMTFTSLLTTEESESTELMEIVEHQRFNGRAVEDQNASTKIQIVELGDFSLSGGTTDPTNMNAQNNQKTKASSALPINNHQSKLLLTAAAADALKTQTSSNKNTVYTISQQSQRLFRAKSIHSARSAGLRDSIGEDGDDVIPPELFSENRVSDV